MLAEFFKELKNTVEESRKLQVFHFPGDPDHVSCVVQPDGTWERLEADPQPLLAQAGSLADLMAAVKYHAEEDFEPVIWYNLDCVTAILAEDRRPRIGYKLQLSTPFTTLRRGKISLSQKDFIQLLKTTFNCCLDQFAGLVEVLKVVKFKAGSESVSTVAHGQRSIGKALETAVTGTGNIPEFITFGLPVLANHDCPWRVKIIANLFPDPQAETFELTVLPGEIERAEQEILDKIGERLEGLSERKLPIFQGVCK